MAASTQSGATGRLNEPGKAIRQMQGRANDNHCFNRAVDPTGLPGHVPNQAYP